MIKMKATKALKYGTRRLAAGDDFEVKRKRDAKILSGIGKAELAPAAPPAPAPQATPPKPAPAPVADDLAAVRAEYEDVLGKRPFFGWGIESLREKIAAHKADDDA